jgi:iron complex transport system ATP-binding protein
LETVRIRLLGKRTSQLDFRNQTLILRMISKLGSGGLIVIMTSHVRNHAITDASYVALMNQGRLVVTGRPDEVITEQNLKDIYKIDVKILEVHDPVTGRMLKFCEPLK